MRGTDPGAHGIQGVADMDDALDALPATELLLTHAEFLSSLSSRLVSPDADSDDLQQETWLSALRHPPTDAGAMRGWLAKVARNHALQAFRARRRRVAREEWSSRDEGVPSTADIVAREGARQAVVDSLTKLSEPYRSTLLLRFYEDLPPREVARRLGIPVETARTRIKRGLALLRDDLDRRSGGDRSAWVSALAPLAASVSAGGAGGLALLGWGLGAVLAIALLVGGAFAPKFWEAPGEEAASAWPLATDGSSSASRGRDNPSSTARLAVASAARSFRLRITFEGSGAPLAGAAVRVDGAEASPPDSPEPTLVADETGQVALPSSLGVGDRITVFATRQSRTQQLVVDARALQGEVVELSVKRASSVSGRVLDLDGRPVAGADVWASAPDAASSVAGAPRDWLARTTTNSEGEFELLELPRSAYVHARFGRSIAVRGAQFSRPEFATYEHVEVTLDDAWDLAGRVVDDAGAPIEGALIVGTTIDLRGPGGAAETEFISMRDLLRVETRSGADGGFVLSGAPPTPRNLVATHESTASEPLRVVAAASGLTLVIPRSRVVEFAVSDARGAPVSAEIAVLAASSERRVVAAPAGLARLTLPAGDTSLWVHARSSDCATIRRRFDVSAADDELIELALPDPVAVEARVLARDSTPLAGVDVLVYATDVESPDAGGDALSMRLLAEGVTDAEGAAALHSLAAGEYEFVLLCQGRECARQLRRVSATSSTQQFTVDAPSPRRLMLRVLDGSSGELVSGCVVTARSGRGDRARTVVARADGEAQLELPHDGPWIVFVRAAGFAPTSERFAAESTIVEREVELLPQRTLRVEATDLRGVRIDTARLLLASEDGSPIATSISERYWANYVDLASGEAIVRGLPARRIRVDVRSPYIDDLPPTFVDLRSEHEGVLRIQIPFDLSCERRDLPLRLSGASENLAGTVEVFTTDGTLCVRFPLRFDAARKLSATRSMTVLAQRYAEDGVCNASSLQRVEGDSLTRDFGHRIDDNASDQIVIPAPAEGGTVVLSLEGREPVVAKFARGWREALTLDLGAR